MTMHPHVGGLVLLLLFVSIIAWYYWLSPLERELCRKLVASESRHLWANICGFGHWVKEQYDTWRAKKA